MMRVLFITTEWPTKTRPYDGPFLVEYANALQKAGVPVEVFHFQGRGNPLNYLKAWLDIRKSAAWREADILHAHWGQNALLGLFSKKPLVITFHGSDLQGIVRQDGTYTIKGNLLVFISKKIARWADRVIVVSDRLKSYLPEGIAAVHVIPMGVDLAVFQPRDQLACRERLGLDPDKRTILFTSDPGRPEKRYSLAREAVDKLAASCPIHTHELLVVNNQPHQLMPDYLNAGDVLLLTSSHEGSPVVIKEALACNLSIVSVDVGDVSERIQDIQGCYLCPNDRAETIAQYLAKALAHNGRIDGLSTVQRYAWEVVAQQTISVYRNCLE